MRRLRSLPPLRPSAAAVGAMLVLCAESFLAPRAALAQDRGANLQLGLGAFPGLGLQTGYVTARGVYTFGGLAVVHATPRFAGGENNVQVAAAFGAALRPLGVVRAIGNTGFTPYDVDLGLRIGPGLTFYGGDETLADKNKRFSLVFEPFVRITTDVLLGAAARTLYLEAGVQRPYLRAGFWLRL